MCVPVLVGYACHDPAVKLLCVLAMLRFSGAVCVALKVCVYIVLFFHFLRR